MELASFLIQLTLEKPVGVNVIEYSRYVPLALQKRSQEEVDISLLKCVTFCRPKAQGILPYQEAPVIIVRTAFGLCLTALCSTHYQER